MNSERTVAVLGAGGWGTALALHLARVGHDVRLWARDPALAREMSTRRTNAVYLPDITLPENIIAIAAGVVEGLGLGHNALAALITRGLAEMTRVACAAGGRRETLAGLSGLGDLVLTCTGTLSRNRHVGLELARGRRLPEILAGMKMVAEGVRTTGAALALGARYGIELPIATQMDDVLAGRTDVRSAITALMLRPQRAEAEADTRIG